MKNLGNTKDVETTNKAAEEKQNRFVKIPGDKTPWILLSLDYADGFVHWIKAGGISMRVVCGGGLEGNGFAPNVCPLCALTHERYSEAKELEQSGNNGNALTIRQGANDMRARMEVHVKVIRGTKVLVKEGKKKYWESDFDLEDTDGNISAGILPLSSFQWEGLTGLIEGENTPFIKSGTDLGSHILWTKKESRKGKTTNYSAVVWDADEEEGIPDIEVDKDLMGLDLTENFVIKTEELEKAVNLLTGESSEAIADDEEVDLETDSEEEPDDADLDDDEESADLDDLDDDDDPETVREFEDDIPVVKKPVKTKKPSGKLKVGGSKSGKARL